MIKIEHSEKLDAAMTRIADKSTSSAVETLEEEIAKRVSRQDEIEEFAHAVRVLERSLTAQMEAFNECFPAPSSYRWVLNSIGKFVAIQNRVRPVDMYEPEFRVAVPGQIVDACVNFGTGIVRDGIEVTVNGETCPLPAAIKPGDTFGFKWTRAEPLTQFPKLMIEEF